MRKGDYGTKLKFTITDEMGMPVNLTNAIVKLVLKLANDVKTFDCVIENAEAGEVRYITQSDFLEYSGKAEIELDITFPDGHFTSTKIKEKIEKTIL